MFSFIEDEALRAKAIEAHEATVAGLQDSIDLKVNEAVDGLKAKNQELLDEKKNIQKTLKNFENIDPEAAREALKFLEENEDAQLIKDGKVSELIDKRTSQMKSDHEAVLSELMDKLDGATKESDRFQNLYQTKVIEDSLREASIGAKVINEAISDILLRGRSVFSVAEDGSVEARDKDGKLLKTEDGKVLTPTLYIEGLKKTSPHYWPPSSGAGAQGGSGTDQSDITSALDRAATSGDMAEFKRLRKLQQNGK